MMLTISTPDEKVYQIDVEPNELVENVKAILEVEAGIPIASQVLIFNGRQLHNAQKLQEAGVGDCDLLMLAVARAPAAAAPPAAGAPRTAASVARPAGPPPAAALLPDGRATDPSALREFLFSNKPMMAQLWRENPQFAAAISANDLPAIQDALVRTAAARAEMARRQEQDAALRSADPFDVDAQRRIEETIRDANVHENYENAMEHSPEVFGTVIMLYVEMEVNGTPVKAFVDSGAQMTIVGQACARRCGLLRLLDKRFHGEARGVGTGKIIGRVHAAPLKVGGVTFTCSFTVMESDDMEFLFGLDMLRRHQCAIDLQANVLRLGVGSELISVPFLAEKDLPAHAKGQAAGESTESRDAVVPTAGGTAGAGPAGAGPAVAGPAGNGGPLPAAPVAPVDAKLSQLVALGFEPALAAQALEAAGGNVEAAASMLFGGM